VFLFLTEKACRLGPNILSFADELDISLRQAFSQKEMAIFKDVLHSLAEPLDSGQNKNNE
jgi:hypothetical protein